LFANKSAQILRHSDVTIMLKWYRVSVEDFLQTFFVNPDKTLKDL